MSLQDIHSNSSSFICLSSSSYDVQQLPAVYSGASLLTPPKELEPHLIHSNSSSPISHQACLHLNHLRYSASRNLLFPASAPTTQHALARPSPAGLASGPAQNHPPAAQPAPTRHQPNPQHHRNHHQLSQNHLNLPSKPSQTTPKQHQHRHRYPPNAPHQSQNPTNKPSSQAPSSSNPPPPTPISQRQPQPQPPKNPKTPRYPPQHPSSARASNSSTPPNP